jgi:hypothetical protein
MSAIFKNRKIPKHLIIEEEPPYRRRSRTSTAKMLVWVLIFSLIIWLGLQFASVMAL